MSDMHENGLHHIDTRAPRLEAMGSHGDIDTLEYPVEDTAPGKAMKPGLQTIKTPRPQTLTEAQTVPTFFSLSSLASDSAWIAEQPTWLMPAMPKSTRANKQAHKPIVQEHATKNEQVGSGVQSYLSIAIDMVKSSGIYAVGALASPLVSLILTPFLAHHLSGTDYGALSVLYTIVDLVTAITQLGLGSAFFRAYNSDYETTRDREDILTTTILLLSLASIPIALIMMFMAAPLSVLLFNSAAFGGSVALTALVIVMENLTLPGISWFRAEKRPIPYSVLSVINLLVVLVANIVLVGMLHMGINGALIAKGAGFAAIVVYTLPLILLRLARKHGLRLRPDIAWSMLAFGVPTVFGAIASWVLQLSDRYLLSHFGSLAQTASYSVAYVLGGVLSPVILAPWGLAWVPIMYAIAKRDDAAHIFKLVFRWWSSFLLFAAFGLSLLSSLVLDLLFPPSYHAAEPVIPIIALSTMLMGVWYILMIGVNIRRKTILVFIYLLIAAVVNLLLNLFFIPSFGAIGAAVSTLIAYIILAMVTYIVNQRIYPIGFEIGAFVLRTTIGVALYIACSLLAHGQKPLIGWSISISTLILYGVFLMLLAGLSMQKLIKAFTFVQAALEQEGMKAYIPRLFKIRSSVAGSVRRNK